MRCRTIQEIQGNDRERIASSLQNYLTNSPSWGLYLRYTETDLKRTWNGGGTEVRRPSKSLNLGRLLWSLSLNTLHPTPITNTQHLSPDSQVTTCAAPRTKSKVRVIPKDGARPSVWQVQSYCIFLATQWALINFFLLKIVKTTYYTEYQLFMCFFGYVEDMAAHGIMVSWYHIF